MWLANDAVKSIQSSLNADRPTILEFRVIVPCYTAKVANRVVQTALLPTPPHVRIPAAGLAREFLAHASLQDSLALTFEDITAEMLAVLVLKLNVLKSFCSLHNNSFKKKENNISAYLFYQKPILKYRTTECYLFYIWDNTSLQKKVLRSFKMGTIIFYVFRVDESESDKKAVVNSFWSFWIF